jgi:hypothetical protein
MEDDDHILMAMPAALRADGWDDTTVTLDEVREYAEHADESMLARVRSAMRAIPPREIFDGQMMASLVAALQYEGVTADGLSPTDIDGYVPFGTTDDEARRSLDNVRVLLREAEAHEQRSE